jgi:hypothetical protein
MKWFGSIFIAVIAVLVFVRRRELAREQALVLGGSILPGCVIAEAIALLALAIAIFLWSR